MIVVVVNVVKNQSFFFCMLPPYFLFPRSEQGPNAQKRKERKNERGDESDWTPERKGNGSNGPSALARRAGQPPLGSGSARAPPPSPKSLTYTNIRDVSGHPLTEAHGRYFAFVALRGGGAQVGLQLGEALAEGRGEVGRGAPLGGVGEGLLLPQQHQVPLAEQRPVRLREATQHGRRRHVRQRARAATHCAAVCGEKGIMGAGKGGGGRGEML